MKKKSWQIDLAVLAAVLICVLVQVIRCGDLPGLYMDAVNPDYAAVQLRWPGLDNEKGMVAWPWLTQVYHGNLAMIPTFISVLITGTTSILQMHVVYGIMISLCIMLIYLMMKQQGAGLVVRSLTALAAATMPMALTMTMTQHYVELPATVPGLASLLCLLKWRANKEKEKLLLLSYFLLGLACYGYFNFFFFLPSLLLATALMVKEDRWGTIVRGMIVFMAACSFYFVGYTHIALYPDVFSRKLYVIICLLIFMAVFFSALALLWLAYTKGSKKQRVAVTAVCAAVLCAWAVCVAPAVSRMMLLIDVGGTPAGLIERIRMLHDILSGTLSGKAAERLIYNDSVTVLAEAVFWLCGVLSLACAALAACRREWKKDWLWLFGVMAGYGAIGLLFATRMHAQHMIPMVFLTMTLIGFEAEYLISAVKGNRAGMAKGLAAALFCLLIGLNVFNTGRITAKIQETGGTAMYTHQINELSDRAYENIQQGRKELYVFRDWGFLYGFTYLTRNQVKSVWDWNEEPILSHREQGYDVIICAWDEAVRDEAHAFLEKIGGGSGTISVETRLEKNGDVAFYELRLTGS